eukprot:7327932-Lingulodinium_polyedra.AAC.1
MWSSRRPAVGASSRTPGPAPPMGGTCRSASTSPWGAAAPAAPESRPPAASTPRRPRAERE